MNKIDETVYRLIVAIILISVVSISGYYRHKADKESEGTLSRKKDGPVMMMVIKIGGLILWLSPMIYIIYPEWMSWSKIGIPDFIRLSAIGLGILCVGGIYWLFSYIGSGISPTSATRKNHILVTSGPYKWVRHPLYTVGSLTFISFGLMADSWLIISLGILAFIIMAIRTSKEEENLIKKFGDEYIEYMKDTGRYFPRLGKRL